MKPMNFPARKQIRQVNALDRMNALNYKQLTDNEKDQIKIVKKNTSDNINEVPNPRAIRTKKRR